MAAAVAAAMMMITNERMICASERANKRMSGNFERLHKPMHIYTGRERERDRVRKREHYTHPIKSGNEHQKVDKEIEKRGKSSEKLQIAMNV